MKDLTIKDILGIEDNTPTPFEIEEWDGKIYIRVMDSMERSALEDLFMKVKDVNRGSGQFRKALLQATITDKEGTQLLKDEAVAVHFMKKNGMVVEKIFEEACERNGFRNTEVEQLKKK